MLGACIKKSPLLTQHILVIERNTIVQNVLKTKML